LGVRLRTAAPNPFRRIVDLLQGMQKKVDAEGAQEQTLFDSYMCYCKTTKIRSRKEIQSAKENIAQLESSLKRDTSTKAQLDSDIVQEARSQASAEASLKAANAQRAKEAAEFQKLKDQLVSNSGALDKAIKAIGKGMSAKFIQTQSADRLRELTQGTSLNELDRQTLLDFLSAGDGYQPRSQEILGILKQIKDELSIAEAEELKAQQAHAMLSDSKKKEIKALQKSREVKTARVAEVSVEIANFKEDLDDSKASLVKSKAFLKDLVKSCKLKKKDWQTRSKARKEELIAIGETIKMLNNDEARELINKATPNPSFLQTQAVNSDVVDKARTLLRPRSLAHHDNRLDLISMSLKAKKVNMDKVLKSIQDMLKLLREEQKHDETKKAFCDKALDSAEDDQTELEAIIKKSSKQLIDAQAKVGSLQEEIDALTAGMAALDKQVSEATRQRKAEHAKFREELASSRAAAELLDKAKTRLLQFYAKRAKPTASPDDVDDAAPTFVQVSDMQDDEEASGEEEEEEQKPEEPSKEYEESKDGGRAIELIMKLKAEVAGATEEMKVEEKNAQQDYEQLVKDAKEKRASDTRKGAELEGMKADMQAKNQKVTEMLRAKQIEMEANKKLFKKLHAECDWLTKNFAARKEVRGDEMDALKSAMGILTEAKR